MSQQFGLPRLTGAEEQPHLVAGDTGDQGLEEEPVIEHDAVDYTGKSVFQKGTATLIR